MTGFIQGDYFAGISDAVITDLQRRLLRGNENDATIIRATYTTHVTTEYTESFWLDVDEVAGLVVKDDGMASVGDNRFSGAPSLVEFVEYVRRGRP